MASGLSQRDQRIMSRRVGHTFDSGAGIATPSEIVERFAAPPGVGTSGAKSGAVPRARDHIPSFVTIAQTMKNRMAMLTTVRFLMRWDRLAIAAPSGGVASDASTSFFPQTTPQTAFPCENASGQEPEASERTFLTRSASPRPRTQPKDRPRPTPNRPEPW
jgi:hypothetical protein